MKTFIKYILEKANALHVYDIDDTLVRPTAKIHVRDKAGQIVKTLNTHEYARSSRTALPRGHSYDFGEFRSAEKFNKESKPDRKSTRLNSSH
jgi:hypothetical protein